MFVLKNCFESISLDLVLDLLVDIFSKELMKIFKSNDRQGSIRDWCIMLHISHHCAKTSQGASSKQAQDERKGHNLV